MEHSKEWDINSEQIVISGSSAGAITALQAEYNLNHGDETTRLLPEGFHYAGVIAFAGAVFSLEGAPKWENKPAPMMLFHGNSDTQVPYNKMALFGLGMYGSKYIADRLEEKGWPYWFYTIEYEDHSMSSSPMRENMPRYCNSSTTLSKRSDHTPSLLWCAIERFPSVRLGSCQLISSTPTTRIKYEENWSHIRYTRYV
jgi:hypothetical protein